MKMLLEKIMAKTTILSWGSAPNPAFSLQPLGESLRAEQFKVYRKVDEQKDD